LFSIVLSNKDDLAVLRRVARILGTWGNPKAIDPLLKLLDCDDFSVLEATAIAFSKIGTPTLKPLIKALHHKKSTARQAVALALGELGDLAAATSLLELFESDDLPEVRGQAAIALGAIGDRSVEGHIRRSLEKHLTANSPTVRYAAAVALKELCDSRSTVPLMFTLKDTETKVSQTAAEAFRVLGDTAIFYLKKELLNDTAEVREVATIALGCTDVRQATELLVDLLLDENPYVRAVAAMFLGQTQNPPISSLREMLHHSRPEVRLAAITALGHIGNIDAIPWFKQKLKDNNCSVRAGALVVLAKHGEDIVPFVEANMTQHQITVKTLSTQLELSVTDRFDTLNSLLKCTNRDISEMAASSLVTLAQQLNSTLETLNLEGVKLAAPLTIHSQIIDMKNIIPILIKLLNSKDTHIQKNAALILAELKDKYFGGPRVLQWQFLNGSSNSHRAAIHGLKIHHNTTVKFLIHNLHYPKPGIREESARILGLWGATRATLPLIKMIDDFDPFVREAAIEALGRLGIKQAVEPLTLRMLIDDNPFIRLEIIRALVEIGDEHAIDRLQVISKDSNENIANAARDAIKRLTEQI